MKKEIVNENGVLVAIIHSSEIVITDVESALDFIATIRHYDNCDRIAINKEAIAENFFDLSSGIAGAVLQKFVNYSMKLAIFGDFSSYTSKSLRDFIYECNNGNAIFFAANQEQATEKLLLH